STACNNQAMCSCSGADLHQDGDKYYLQTRRGGSDWVTIGRDDVWGVTGGAFSEGDKVTVRMCKSNAWGSRCGDPVSFTFGYSRPCADHGYVRPSRESSDPCLRAGPRERGCVRSRPPD